MPRPTSGRLVLAEARERPVAVLRLTETRRHVYRLIHQRANHPLPYSLLERIGARWYSVISDQQKLLPTQATWEALALYDAGIDKKTAVSVTVAGQLASFQLVVRFKDTI